MWHLRLIGSRDSVEKLSHRFSDGDVRIYLDAEGGVLTATELEQFTDHMAVLGHAKALVEVLSGILSLEFDFEPVQVGSLNRMEGAKKHAFAVGVGIAAASAVMSGTGAVRDSTGGLKQDGERTEQLRRLVTQDPAVADFLGRHPDHAGNWGGLYKLYEIVRLDVGGEQPLDAKRWIDPADRELFTRTANHSKAAGRAARHAASITAPPKCPMPLNEAKQLIRRLGVRWLDEKLTKPPLEP